MLRMHVITVTTMHRVTTRVTTMYRVHDTVNNLCTSYIIKTMYNIYIVYIL